MKLTVLIVLCMVLTACSHIGLGAGVGIGL